MPSLPVPETAARASVTEALRERYRTYRLEQGRELLRLVPREGLRALVRSSGSGDETSLDELAARCADLLPLPPLSVWMRDFQAHREAHLAHRDPLEAGPRSPNGGPVAVAVRHFRFRGEAWVGRLQVWPRADRWEGAIEFQSSEGGGSWRTAAVFREESAAAVRERFGIFDDSTLSAFLRSALP